MDVLGVIVGTRPRSGADAASGDPTPTASGDREQDFPDWLQPFTEGQAKGESESSGSAGGKQFPKHLVHISQRDPRTNLAGNTFDSVIFRRTPILIHAKRTKITRDPCRRNPESREDRIPQATKFGATRTADHKVLNAENESRVHHRYAVVVEDGASPMDTKLFLQKQDCTR